MSVWTEDRAYVSEQYGETVRAMSLGPVWDHLGIEDNATSGMVRGILAAVAEYLRETGYTPST